MIFKKASRLLQESLKQLAVAGNLRPYHIMGSPGSKNRLEALHLLFIGCSIAEKCFYVLLDPSVSTQFHSHLGLALSQSIKDDELEKKKNGKTLAFLDVVDYVCLCVHTACLYAKQKKVK